MTRRDWSDEYANGAYIPQADQFPSKWQTEASEFRNALSAKGRAALNIAYGADPRETYDAYFPAGTPNGLAVVVHGGYWRSFSKDDFSHLAAGAVARGWVAVVPNYPLCPAVGIGSITRSIANALQHAANKIDGPIRLTGHSAGGHLVTRMMCRDVALPDSVTGRLQRVMSISGLHDLRPLIHVDLNEVLNLDFASAAIESPALLAPRKNVGHIAWVGADERPEFIRQSELIALMWRSFDTSTSLVVEPERHHFNVIEGLCRENSPLMEAWLG